MNLLQIKDASILFGQPPIIDRAQLNVQTGERVCVVGRNGSGKSTLLKVISKDIKLDEGQLIIPTEVVVSRLPQDPPENITGTMFDYVAEGLEGVAQLLKDYHHVIIDVTEDPSEKNLNKMQVLQEQLDARNAWQFEQRISNVLTQLQLEPEQKLSELSGGWRRKAALARSLVSQPDLLLLDEPTNHLDIEMVQWLEKALLNYQGAIIFISHDRAFIRRLATRIIDIDRGQVVSYPGDYEKYLVQKAHDLDVEENKNSEFDKKLAKEEVWIRQGIKARRTRNEGRVRALKSLRNERSARRQQMGKAVISQQNQSRSGKIIFELTGASYTIDNKVIISHFDLLVNRGEKLALIGPNGCGKSTLIKLLLGDLQPDSGEIRVGTNLEVAYFDQHRSQLPLNESVIDVIADGKREVDINGNSKHVISYLQDYLFTPERVNAPVSTLSGGERNRLMLAKLMLKPSNLLILDEPTNDLDVETLELLETLLVDYTGTVILVSHDREFVDNVVTTSLVFEGDGKVQEFVGGYSDIRAWYDAQTEQLSSSSRNDKPTVKANIVKESKPLSAPVNESKKLSYKDQQELNKLPVVIEELETEQAQVQSIINQHDFFQQESQKTETVLQRLANIETSLSKAYARWDELEN